MRREVRREHEAVEELFQLSIRDAKLGRRLMFAIRSYRNGSRVDLKKLAGQGDRWRIRVGDWRIILLVDGNEAAIEAIDNRRDAY